MIQNCIQPCENVCYEVVKDRFTDEFFFDETLMLNYDISLPKLRTQGANIDYITINSYYSNLGAQLRNHAKLELYPQAVEDYEERKENNYPFFPYNLFTVYKATFTSPKLFSTYIDVSEYTGGAHPNTVRSAQTWDLCKGIKLELSQLFAGCGNWRSIIMKQIAIQADMMSDILFEDYKPMLKEYFDPNNFYLTPNGLVIYYPLYTIAPYVSGIIGFEISYNKLCSCLRDDLFCKRKQQNNFCCSTQVQPFNLGRL